GGASLLTFVTVLVNAALWLLLEWALGRRLGGRSRAPLPALATAAAIWAAVLAYGVLRLQQVNGWKPLFTVQGAAVQGNIGDFDKIAAERGIRGAAEKVLATYFGLTDRALQMDKKPELVIWPETAYPSSFGTPTNTDELLRDQRVEAFVRDRGVPLLFG